MSEISLTPSQTVELAFYSQSKMRRKNLKMRHTLLLKQNFKTNYTRSLVNLMKMREYGDASEFQEEADNYRAVLLKSGMKPQQISRMFSHF